jgi:RES domain-containing protein
MATSGRVHDRAILDALDAMDPVPFEGRVWRITRAGRDATRGSAANGRWSPGGTVEVLYTSLERDGALAEIGYRLSLEPVWPSRLQHEIHELSARSERALRFADVASLATLGVDVPRYESFDYSATQALAAAAHFLEFDGLLVPSARHSSANLVLFMDRGLPGSIEIKSTESVDWANWRRQRGRSTTS